MAKILEDWAVALQYREQVGYGSVNLYCDGYNMTWEMTRIKNKLVFVYFIDGHFKGDFCQAESPIGQKFGVVRYHRLKNDYYKLLIKIEGKKVADAEKKKASKIVLCYMFYHPSAASVIRTLKKTCKDIKLI